MTQKSRWRRTTTTARRRASHVTDALGPLCVQLVHGRSMRPLLRCPFMHASVFLGPCIPRSIEPHSLTRLSIPEYFSVGFSLQLLFFSNHFSYFLPQFFFYSTHFFLSSPFFFSLLQNIHCISNPLPSWKLTPQLSRTLSVWSFHSYYLKLFCQFVFNSD